MKILVDQAELMKAFEIISDCKNDLRGDGWVKKRLQTVCNILGPMWADGIDENKVLYNPVDTNRIKKLIDITSDMADIINAYLWNTHTKESERSARLLDDTIKELEELQSENISR